MKEEYCEDMEEVNGDATEPLGCVAPVVWC